MPRDHVVSLRGASRAEKLQILEQRKAAREARKGEPQDIGIQVKSGRLDMAGRVIVMKGPDSGSYSYDSDNAKKWNPGHYLQVPFGTYYKTQSNRFALYDSKVQGESSIQGAIWYARWAELESTLGDYTAGIALIQAELDHLKSYSPPKRLCIRLPDADYGATEPTSEFPDFVNANDWDFQVTKQGGTNVAVVLRRWLPEVTDARVNLLGAIAAAFDDDPYFEAVGLIGETAGNWSGTTPPADWSAAKEDTEFKLSLIHI